MLIERSFTRSQVGTLRVTGDLPTDEQEFKLKHIEWGEFQDLSGALHGPLTKDQCVGIMSLADEEWKALAIVEQG